MNIITLLQLYFALHLEILQQASFLETENIIKYLLSSEESVDKTEHITVWY